MDALGVDGDGRYRILNESQVIQGLLFMIWHFDAREDPPRAVARASQALARWIARGLPFRRDGDRRLFDLCEVANFMRKEGLDGRDPAYRQELVPNARRLTLDSLGSLLRPDDSLDIHSPCRFEVSLRREYNLEGQVPGTPLRLRLPVPYEDDTQREIGIEVVTPTPPEAEVTSNPGRLDFRLRVPQDRTSVALEARITLTAMLQTHVVDRAPRRPAVLAEEERELYTHPREGMIRITPAVLSLARSLRGDDDDPWSILNVFWNFFFRRMKPGLIHHSELDPADPLGSLVERTWFDCYCGSALLIGLCRAAGIPARLVNGIILHEPTGCSHFWAEAFIAPHGWIPIDLLSWDLSAGTIQDAQWSRLLLGRMDYRMKCQSFPHQVVGPTGVQFPPAWYILPTLSDRGTETFYYALDRSRLVYRERVSVIRHRPNARSM